MSKRIGSGFCIGCGVAALLAAATTAAGDTKGGKPAAAKAKAPRTCASASFSLGVPQELGIGTESPISFGGIGSGDVDGDGKVDLVAGAAWYVYAFLGNGDGTFREPVVSRHDAGHGSAAEASVLALVDVDGDKKLDLVGNGGNSKANVALGLGDGAFGPVKELTDYSQSIGLAAADFNADGKLDVAAPTSGGFSVALNAGKGAFAPAARYETYAPDLKGPSPSVLAAGDFNGDRKIDLVVDGNRSVWIYLNAGAGQFKAKGGVSYPAPSVGGGSTDGTVLATGDFNGDGKTDVVTSARKVDRNALDVFLNKGDGTLGPAKAYAFTDAMEANGIIAADLNNDGRQDIVMTAGQIGKSSTFVWMNNGDGTFSKEPAEYGTSTASGSQVTVGDFLGDGLLGVATLNAEKFKVVVLGANCN